MGNAQLRHAEYADFDIGPHLIQPIRDDGSLAHHFGFAPELLVSKAAYTGLGKISCEDIVLYRTDAAELQIGVVQTRCFLCGASQTAVCPMHLDAGAVRNSCADALGLGVVKVGGVRSTAE